MKDSLQVLLIFFIMLYSAMLGFLALRLRGLKKFGLREKVAKIFYLSILVFVKLRLIGLIILLSCYDVIEENLEFLVIEVPHAASLLPFILLAIIKLEKTYEAHISSHVSKTFIANTKKKSRIQSFKPAILVYVGVLYLGFTILIVLCLVNVIDQKIIDTFLGCFDITVSIALLIFAIILQKKFSGMPTKSEKWGKVMKKINAVTIFWITGRTLRSILDIISFITQNSQTNKVFHANVSITGLIFGLISVFLTEVFNIALTIDYSFFSIFVHEKVEFVKSEQPKDRPMRKTAGRMSMVELNPYIEENEIETIEEIAGRNNGLGKIYKAKHLEKNIAYRKIMISNISTYVAEEINEEVESYKQLCISGLVRVRAIVLNQTTVGFAYRFYNTSLYNALHISKLQMDFQKKLAILGQIAEILSDIHSEDKVHGHLTSHNIFLDGDEILISDLGFHKLKKYVGIKNNYSYKSAWSSPEILKDTRLTPANLHYSCDVYSFGMICWEILTENEPFPQYTVDQIRKKVVEEGSRPMIPTGLDKNLVRVIQSCFNEDFNTRPEMSMLTNLLSY